MEVINELPLRDLLTKKLSTQDLLKKIEKLLLDPSLSWEEKRPLWHFLHNTGRDKQLMNMMHFELEQKNRVPFELLIEVSARANIQPGSTAVESVLKGMRKQRALDDILIARGWDKWDTRFAILRAEMLENKADNNRKYKEGMVDKFEFLKSQRMTEQVGQVLKRLIDLYPEDEDLKEKRKAFDEEWARNVLSNHVATLQTEAFERTHTQPSTADEEMLQAFVVNGEKAVFEHREFAYDLAVAFWFLEDYARAMQIIVYAPAGQASDWLRAELLFASRRYLEAMEHLNMLEIKYIEEPENTFAVSYLRAQCLYGLGQRSSALEILQSIVRVRSNYRSAHALILDWTAGVTWE